ncbi:MAG: Gfo/Idh/MocA family protein [Bacteroidia bacterium]
MENSKVKIGLLGVGHLGKIHLRILKSIPEIEFIGFFDQDSNMATQVSEEFEVPAFQDMASLLEACDAVDIVTPTLAHFAVAQQALQAGKHVFIEKPVTSTVEEAQALLTLAKQTGTTVQVGHVERFNPAFLAASGFDLEPQFVEGHRLAMYNPRGTDVSVVLDLMIHDIDVLLSVVKSPVKQIDANGVSVVSKTADIANARIAFENGCVANLTASRISLKNMRRLRFFQPSAYVAIDFLEKNTEVVRLSNEAQGGGMSFPIGTGDESRFLQYEKADVQSNNAIKMELESFAASILKGEPVRVSLEDGVAALVVAQEVAQRIESQVNS